MDKRTTAQHRTSQPPSKIHRIEETPHSSEGESLPVPGVEKKLLASSLSGTSTGDLSTSPSQASILSTRSDASTSSAQGNRSPQSGSASLLRSKFAPSWLFNPFRSGPSQAETSPSRRRASLPPSEVFTDKVTLCCPLRWIRNHQRLHPHPSLTQGPRSL